VIRCGPQGTCLALIVFAGVLVSCKPDTKIAAPEIRPVRTVTVARGEAAEIVLLTGHVQAEDEPALAFRIGGRMIERPVNVGDRVEAGQVLAKLDPENELNELRSAESALVATQGQLTPGSISRKTPCKTRNLRSTTPKLNCGSPETVSAGRPLQPTPPER